MIGNWVHTFTPVNREAARSHRHRVGSRWSLGETCICIAGRWCYVFRAVDEDGQIIEIDVSAQEI
jgi:transposase-like protein